MAAAAVGVSHQHTKEAFLTSQQAPAQLDNLASPASEKLPPSVHLRLWASRYLDQGLQVHWLVCKPWGPFRSEADPCMMR